MAKNPGGDHQGVGGGVNSKRVINTPRVEELPQEDKNSGVKLKGNRVTGEDRQGRGGDGKTPTTRETNASGDIGSEKEMTSGLGPAPIPHRGTESGRGSEARLHRHPGGARPERASKYRLLAPAETAGDPSAAELQECGMATRPR